MSTNKQSTADTYLGPVKKMLSYWSIYAKYWSGPFHNFQHKSRSEIHERWVVTGRQNTREKDGMNLICLITFQTTFKCGLNLICKKNQCPCSFCQLPKKADSLNNSLRTLNVMNVCGTTPLIDWIYCCSYLDDLDLDSVFFCVCVCVCRQYNRLRNLIKDPRHDCVLFANEFQEYSYCPREKGESQEKWQTRSVLITLPSPSLSTHWRWKRQIHPWILLYN